PGDFEKIQCSPGLLKHSGEEGLVLIATDADPQLYLPAFQPEAEPSRLEITLQVVLDWPELASRYHRALGNDSFLRAAGETLNATLIGTANDLSAIRHELSARSKDIDLLTAEREALKQRAEEAEGQIKKLKLQADEAQDEISVSNLRAL